MLAFSGTTGQQTAELSLWIAWSDMLVLSFINDLIKSRDVGVYCGVGGNAGDFLNAIAAPRKYYVQRLAQPTSGGADRDSEGQPLDLVYISGMHLAEEVLANIDAALARLVPSGIILLYNCLPKVQCHQERAGNGGPWTGDVWKAVVALRQRPDIDVATYEAEWGLAVILPRPNTSPLAMDDRGLTWNRFRQERDELLRTMQYQQIWAFLGEVKDGSPGLHGDDASDDRVAKALYGQGAKCVDVTEILNMLIDCRCFEFVVSNAMAGDPCPDVLKDLHVIFTNGKSVAFREGGIACLRSSKM